MIIDIIFIGLMLLAFVKGAKKGLIHALFSCLAFFIGMLAAIKLSVVAAHYFSEHSNINGRWIPFISFILIFALVVVIINSVGKILEKTAEITMMSWINKVGGICLFLLLYGILFSVILFYAKNLNFIKKETIESSLFYPYISPLGPDIINNLGKIIPFFKDLFSQLEVYFDSISSKL